MPDPEGTKEKLAELATAYAEANDSDIIIFNYEVLPPVDFAFMGIVTARNSVRKNVALILTTEGGLPDSAFRMMRILQSTYER